MFKRTRFYAVNWNL